MAINDLYAVALPAMAKVGRENDVHFSPEGYALLAEAVAQSIETALKKRKNHDKTFSHTSHRPAAQLTSDLQRDATAQPAAT